MRGVVSRHEPETKKENHAAHNLGAFATPLQATRNNSMKHHPNRKRVLRRMRRNVICQVWSKYDKTKIEDFRAIDYLFPIKLRGDF